MQSSRKVALDDAMLPTGKLDDTTGTGFDFTKGTAADPSTHRRIGDGFPSSGIGLSPSIPLSPLHTNVIVADNCIVFNTPTRSPTTPAVVMSSPNLKTSLSFFTNQSAVQMYTANFFGRELTRKSHHQIASGEGYQKHGSSISSKSCPLLLRLSR